MDIDAVIEAVHQYPSHYKEAPLIDDRNPIEVKVVPALKYRGPPSMPVSSRQISCIFSNKMFQYLSWLELLSNEQKNKGTVFDH